MKKTILKYSLLAFGIGIVSGYLIMTFFFPAIPEKSECSVQTEVRMLLADQAYWTRSYLISILSKLDDTKETFERLVQNEEKIGAMLASWYGKEAGEQFTTFLKEQMDIAAQLVTKVQSNKYSIMELKKMSSQLHKNTEATACFLANLNPHWSKAQILTFLNKQLDLITDEARARMGKKWNNEILVFDKILDHVAAFADYLAAGITKQLGSKRMASCPAT